MSELLFRTTATDLSVRGTGRTIIGYAVPFGAPATVSDDGRRSYTETWQMGAFARTIAERGDRVKFKGQHQRTALPLGRATLLREDPGGLYAELTVSQTPAGDEVLELVRDGTLDSLSIGFAPVPGGEQWNRDRSAVVRTEAKLREISIVDEPAFSGAKVIGVRSQQPTLSLELARRRLALIERSSRWI